MGPYFYVDLTGWMVALLFAITVVVAFFFRSRMEDHYAIGYGIAALSFLHASLAVDGMNLNGPALYGIMLATIAMFISWGQVALGRRLRALDPTARGQVRLFHIATASTLLALGIAHLLVNGPHVRALLGL